VVGNESGANQSSKQKAHVNHELVEGMTTKFELLYKYANLNISFVCSNIGVVV
jgi:hypothetical protein